ncbi:MAG: hypothetical protein WCR54_04645 [Clostridia bacterium]
MRFSTYNTYTTKIIAIILAFVLGIIVAVGAEAGVAYYFLTKQGTLKQVETVANNNGIAVDFGADIENKTILEWSKQLAQTVSNLSSNKIGDIENVVGMPVISDNINAMLGVDKDIIKDSTIENLGQQLSSNMTMSLAKEKLGIEFPDMPLFTNEEFLSSTLDIAFEDLADKPLNQIFTIDENSNAALKSLANVPINELGAEAGDKAISQNCLCDFMDITDTSSKTLQALKYCTLKSYYIYDEDGTTISLDEFGNKTYQTKDIIEGEGESASTLTIPMMGVSDKVEILKVGEVIDITESSHAVLRKMRMPVGEEDPTIFGTENLLVNELGGQKFNDLIDNTKIGEIIDVYETTTPEHEKSEPILIALKDTNIGGLNTKIKVLQLNEIFDNTQLTSGALSLIEPTTTLSNIPGAMTSAVLDCTIITLKEKGLINSSSFVNISSMKKQQQSFIYNSTLSGVLSGMIGFIGDIKQFNSSDPLTFHYIEDAYTNIQFSNIELADTYNSLTEFVNTINIIGTYSNVSAVGASVTVTIDPVVDSQFYNATEDTYYIPVFNLDEDITFDFGGTTIKMEVMLKDGTNYSISRYQYAYYYGPNATHILSAVDTLEYSQQ